MATMHGECGAFRETRKIAARLGIDCAQEDLFRLEEYEELAKRRLEVAQRGCRQRIAQKFTTLAHRDLELTSKIASQIEARSEGRRLRLAGLESMIERRRRSSRGLQALLSTPGTLALRIRRIKLLGSPARADISLVLEQARVQRGHARLAQTAEAKIEHDTRKEAQRVEAFRQLRARPESTGAIAELTVAKVLRELPDSYHVFHDVRLLTDSFMRDADGVPIQSAQVDHVVAGPSGVFVIETKNWSDSFARSERAFNPHAQVTRASLLCHVLLKRAGLGERVRSIISCHRHRVPAQEGSYAKVLGPGELPSYIRWFAEILSPGEVDRFARFFQGYQLGSQ